MYKEQLLAQLNETFEILGCVRLDQWDLDFSPTTFDKLTRELKQLHRDAYTHDQRIVIVTDQNQFNNEFSYRNFLQKLQKIINQVDISNCFVELLHNSNNQELVQTDCASVSKDPVALSFVHYTDQLKPADTTVDSKVFCILPWTGLMVTPYNEILSCCVAAESAGNLLEHSLADAWNSAEMRRLRLSMLNDAYHSNCARCYEKEKIGQDSSRTAHQVLTDKFSSLALATNADGSTDDFKLRYIDLRFSNLCNIRCRTCNHHSSSKWYADEKKLNPSYNRPVVLKAGRYDLDVWEQLVPHIDTIESIYFAGGEPLIMDEHYWLLEELEKRNKFDTALYYNTNFTVVQQRQRHLFDYWKNFTNITIATSQDASGARGEYLRKDIRWPTIVDNIELVKERLPNVNLKIQCTVSIINSMHIVDFHRECVESKLIGIDDFAINLLQEPAYYRLDVASESFKQQLIDKYLKHATWLKEQHASTTTVDSFMNLINFLNANDYSDQLDEFKRRTTQLDSIRNEDILTVFPELTELFNE